MGSLRRQLIAYMLMAGPAMAEVCAQQRPGWTAADGPATMFNELVQFLIWGGGGVLIAALVLGLYLRKAFILNGVLIVALIMAVPYVWPLDATAVQLAIAEGCIGQPTLVIGLLALVWLGALLGVMRKPKALP
jgi:hypothetical protein